MLIPNSTEEVNQPNQSRKEKMKTTTAAAFLFGVLVASIGEGFCQTNLQFTAVTATSERAIRLNWQSVTNALYQVQYTPTLTNAQWNVLIDNYPSQGTNTFWLDTGNYLQAPAIEHPKNVPSRFYRVDYLGTNSVPPPTVSVVFPTNAMVLSGQVTVTVATASSALPILNAYLYVDGQQMYSSDDGSNFVINTCEWPNGSHILFATAKGQSQLSDPLNSPQPDVAYAASPYVPVTFSNFISQVAFSQPFFEPALGQTQRVTASFTTNCNWTLQIQNPYGNVVRNASGSGTSMVFNWDGTGDGESNISDGVYYYVISAPTSGGPFPTSAMMSTTTAPTRPPTEPGKGSDGIFGVAYYYFPNAGESFDSPLNGLPLSGNAGRVPLAGSYGPWDGTAIFTAPDAANGFAATMQNHCWKVGFNENLPSGRFRNIDLIGASLGGNESFGNVNLGFFIGHGGYGTDVDYNPDASESEETYLLSDSPVDASAPWVRFSECGFGGNLRWMGLLSCNMLCDENYNSMLDAGVLPIPSNLHLLCGSTTICFTTDDIGESWASRMFDRGFVFGSYTPAETVENAWFDGAHESYTRAGVASTVTFRVAGSDNCFTDTLQSYAGATSGNLTYDDDQVAP
jgi:hypothetical protein